MDHPFPTRRHDLQRTREALDLAADVTVLSTLTPADQDLVRARREPLIADPRAKEVLSRRAGRLGLLLEDLDALHNIQLAKAHGAAWEAHWQNKEARLPAALTTDVAAVVTELTALRASLLPIEKDDTSSSYSDYSDSRTVSSSDEESEEENSE